MRRILVLAGVVTAVALGGCSALRGDKGGGPPRSSPSEVRIVPGADGVPQPAGGLLLFAGPRGQKVTITWTLPADGDLRFDRERGIRIVGEVLDQELRDANGNTIGMRLDAAQKEIGDCKPVDAEGLRYACENLRTRSGIYKYAIAVRTAKGRGQLIVNDPPIVNWVGD